MRAQLRAIEVLVRVGERRLPSEHNAGVQTTPDPADGGAVPRRQEATTNTTTGLSIDTAGRRKTLTRRAGDTGELRVVLCPKDMSRLVAIPTGQFNPGFTHVGHPGGAGTVMGQQKKKRKTQAGGHHIPSLVDVQVTGVNITVASCWPTVGRCASCGIEGYRRLRAICIAQGRRCDRCGSQGHLARACTKEMNLHTERGKSCMICKETTPKEGRHRNGGTGVQTQDTRPTQATGPIRRTNLEKDNRCFSIVSIGEHTPFTQGFPVLSGVTRRWIMDPCRSDKNEEWQNEHRMPGSNSLGWASNTVFQFVGMGVGCRFPIWRNEHRIPDVLSGVVTQIRTNLPTEIRTPLRGMGDREQPRHKAKSQTISQLKAWTTWDPYYREVGVNEHRKRRHCYDPRQGRVIGWRDDHRREGSPSPGEAQ